MSDFAHKTKDNLEATAAELESLHRSASNLKAARESREDEGGGGAFFKGGDPEAATALAAVVSALGETVEVTNELMAIVAQLMATGMSAKEAAQKVSKSDLQSWLSEGAEDAEEDRPKPTNTPGNKL